MSAPAHDAQPTDTEVQYHDPVEDVTKHIPVVIPLAGAILMFLLAFIAVKMACPAAAGGWPVFRFFK